MAATCSLAAAWPGLALATPYEPTGDRIELQVDCYAGGVDNTGTNDQIVASFWSASDEFLGMDVFSPACGFFGDSYFEPEGFSSSNWWPKLEQGYIIVQTDGTDAFWMDEIYLDYDDYGDGPDIEIQRWGVDGGGGYCLSQDPADGEGSWSSIVSSSGCASALRFDVATGNHSSVTPRTFTSEELEGPDYYYYGLQIDCYEPGIDDTKSWERFTVKYYNGSELLGQHYREYIAAYCNDLLDSATSLLHFTKPVTHFVVETPGDDAVWIDEMWLRESGSLGGEFYHFGGDGGMGWCLSTDPNDADGWGAAVDGCYRALRFNVDPASVWVANPPSCATSDICGGQAEGACWCDTACQDYGDCCGDYVEYCT